VHPGATLGRGVRIGPFCVVGEVDVGHDEATLADRRLVRLRRTAVDRRVLADRGALTDLHCRHLALELEILWIPTENGADADLHARAEDDVALERRARGDDAAVTDPAVLADDRERTDLHVGAKFDTLVDDRGRMDARVHLSRTMAPISASATTSPSTFATPCILHIIPRT